MDLILAAAFIALSTSLVETDRREDQEKEVAIETLILLWRAAL